MVVQSNVAENLFLIWLLVLGFLFVSSFEVEAQGHATEWLPKVLVVTSTVEPQYARARHLWTDLFEYGIIANVSSTSTYNSMDRSNYDVIIFSGYSNPVDPEDMYLNMLIDIDASRKLIFMNYYPFIQTSSDGTYLKTYYELGIVDMPEDFPSGEFHKPSELSLIGNPGDSYLKDEDPSISNAYFFSTLPVSAIGWVKDETSNRYFAIFTDKGGWIGERSCTTLHMGKVVAKIWWGKTDKSFGFSMNVMYGKQVFLWRVDADKSGEEAPLNWLSDLATQHSLKFSIGARGERIISDVIAGYWRNLATNELAKIGVHTFTHQSPISAQNITHEVIDTYDLMLSYDIPTEKFFLGWGTSDWSWQQIKTLYDYGWTVIHSSREDKFVPDTYNINTIANFTVAPALLGLTGRCDWNADHENFNFTEANINYFQKRKEAHLPFLLLTHDYIFDNESYYNDYGPLKDQVEAFFDWLGSQEIYSVWITEYYDFFQDTFMATISKNNTTFTVTRPKAKANFVKIFVGNNQTYAVGTSVLTQKISDGWLYVTLRPETTSTFILSDAVPTVDFTASPISGPAPLTVSFNDTSTSFDGIISWAWDFENDGVVDSIEQNTTHVYDEGVYTVSLTVQDTIGNNDTETKVNYITATAPNQPPVADANGPYTETEGEPITFDGSVSEDPDGTILSYFWDFGDGQTSTEQNPTQTYSQNGTYVVTLTVTDDDSATDTDITTATVADTSPTADFLATPTSGLEPLTVDFTDLSTSYDGITTWDWDFNNDGVVDSTEQNPTYVYMQDGSYPVTLRVYESDGDSDTEIKVNYVMVTDTEPNADFSATSTSGLEPLQVNFTDFSTSHDGIISWNWSFGDGETSTEQNPIHLYAADGTYPVSLTVSEADEDSSTETKFSYIIVHDSTPVASFTYSPSNPLEGNQVTFNASGSTGYDQPLSYTWNFSDGTLLVNLTDPIVTHTYAHSDSYDVILTVVDSDGSTDSTYQTITVEDRDPVADFSATPTSGLEPLTVGFTDLSTSYDGITTWEWDFNNDDVIDSTEGSPTHTYTNEGTYSVSLTVYEADGDSATDTTTITVLLDTDGDLIPDTTDFDDDNDGIQDDWEILHGLNPLDPSDASLDPDGDGLTNLQEYQGGTDPNVSDVEVLLDTDGDETPDVTDTDDDNDGVLDVDDAFPLDPTETVDTDGDGVGNNADTNDDNDGVPDVDDTFPLDASESVDTDGDLIGNNADTDDDNDEMPDMWETENGLNPLDAADASLDPDGDGLTNLQEYQGDTDPNVSDAQAFPWWVLGAVAALMIGWAVAATFLWRRIR